MAHSTKLTGPKSRLLEADSDSSDQEISVIKPCGSLLDQAASPEAILKIAFSIVTPVHRREHNIKTDLN